MPNPTKNHPLHDRAACYVAQMPAAVSGEGGHRATFAAAVALVHGFGLSEGEAWPILCAHNARCTPPWSERELRHKLTSAAKLTRHPKPRGHLLGSSAGHESLSAPQRPAVEPFQLINPATLPAPPAERKEPVEARREDPEARRIADSLHNLESDHPGLLLREDGTLAQDATLFAAVLRTFGGSYRRRNMSAA